MKILLTKASKSFTTNGPDGSIKLQTAETTSHDGINLRQIYSHQSMGSPNQTKSSDKEKELSIPTSPSPGPTDGTNLMQTNSQQTDSHQSMGSPNQPISSDKEMELSSPASLSPGPIDTLSSPYSDSQPNVSLDLNPTMSSLKLVHKFPLCLHQRLL